MFEDDGRPIFLQLAEQIENDILSGALAEGDQVPSTNEFASFHRINPATAGKGVNLLVDRGVLVKRRGIGMFVADGAKDAVAAARRDRFATDFITPLVAEAGKLGIDAADLIDLVRKETRQ